MTIARLDGDLRAPGDLEIAGPTVVLVFLAVGLFRAVAPAGVQLAPQR